MMPPCVTAADGDVVVGTDRTSQGQRIVSLGYALFDEVAYLLSSGQPPEYARIPTLEIHVTLLRHWIVTSGLAVVEIPPTPAGPVHGLPD